MREKLAALAHEQWSSWMRYLFSKGIFNEDGTWTMPKWAVTRWKGQMETLYPELTEEEKESDRKEADRVLSILWEAKKMTKTKNDGENICVNCGAEMVKVRIEIDDGWLRAWLCKCGIDDEPSEETLS